jgi:hypothetical protein
VRKLDEALDELRQHEVLLSYEKQDQRGERSRILDVKYTLQPHPEFVKQIKAANKRLSINREKAPALAAPSSPQGRAGR